MDDEATDLPSHVMAGNRTDVMILGLSRESHSHYPPSDPLPFHRNPIVCSLAGDAEGQRLAESSAQKADTLLASGMHGMATAPVSESASRVQIVDLAHRHPWKGSRVGTWWGRAGATSRGPGNGPPYARWRGKAAIQRPSESEGPLHSGGPPRQFTLSSY